MNKIYIPTQSPEDWKKLLAEPEKHWKDGYSAKTLAYCWQNANGFPPEISRIFNGSEYTELHDLELLLAFPEYQVFLPPITGHPSQNDLFVLARTQNEKLISMTIEGKVSEPFGHVMKKWYTALSVGKIERLKFIREHIGIKDELPEDLRYQLLHRTASAVIEAKKFNVAIAVMLVHSFSKTDEWFGDYQLFLELYGINDVNVDRLYFLKTVSGIQLYSGWVKGEESNQN